MEWWNVLVVGMITLTTVQATAELRLAETNHVVQEGDQLAVSVVRDGVAGSAINVVLEITDSFNHGGDDFIGASQTTVFPPGVETVTHSVVFTIKDDQLPEPDETFTLRMRVTNGDGRVSVPAQASITIVANDDGFGVLEFFSINQVITTEQVSSHLVPLAVQRLRGTYGSLNLSFEVVGDGSAEPGVDIAPSRGSVMFLEGESIKQINLSILPDQIPENDEEFAVRLTEVTGGNSISPIANRPLINGNRSEVKVVIVTNDAPVRFSQTEYRTDEDSFDTTLRLSVHRGLTPDLMTTIGPVNTPASVSYFVTSVTATPGQDYTASNGTLAFSPGATEATISVLILKDSLPEVAEEFQVFLTEPIGDIVLSSPSIASVVINANDDPHGVLSIKTSNGVVFPSQRINEDTTTVASFPVTRNGGTFEQVSVDWILTRNSSSNESASQDVLPTAGRVEFLPGQTDKMIVLSIIQDNIAESAERFLLQLLPESAVGGARVEGVLQAELIIEDSDQAYGVVELLPRDAQTLVSSGGERKLVLSVSRSGGSLESITVTYDIVYINEFRFSSDLFLSPVPGSVPLPAGQSSYTVDVFIKPQAFLQVDAFFNITLTDVQLTAAAEVGPYNTPRLGDTINTLVIVSTDHANGEVGFDNVTTMRVDEPDGILALITQVELKVTRLGTNGVAQIAWSLVGSGNNPDHLTSDDVVLSRGTLHMVSGQASASITLSILPDNLPEADEQFTVTLLSVEPSATQRLREGATQVDVIIAENDNPGGMFQLSADTPRHFSVQEELDAIELTILRSGGALVARDIEYHIEPNGEVEFYGSTNVIKFQAGEIEKRITVIARDDAVSELDEEFTLVLRSFGEREAAIGPRSSTNITVLANDDPYGFLQFPQANFTATIDESKGANTFMARLPVQRSKGRFDSSSVAWVIPDNSDLYPTSGELRFDPGVGEVVLEVQSVPDELPEGEETFTVTLTEVTGDAKLGANVTASIIIRKNDDAIYFKEPSLIYAVEPSTLTLTVVRDGPTDVIATVRYKTMDDVATEGGRDYVVITESQILFDLGEAEKTVDVRVLDDVSAEPDESFYVVLYEPEGDVVVYGTPNATIIIIANDDANGVFSFAPPMMLQTQEGTAVQFEVRRSIGRYYDAFVFYEILDLSTRQLVPNNTDFVSNVGSVHFKDLQELGYLSVVAAEDGLPEFNESFLLRLQHVTVTKSYLLPGRISASDREVQLEVEASDDPHGVFLFPVSSSEVAIAEDALVGEEDLTRVTLPVQRDRGNSTLVQVAWEAFSYQIAGAGSLPQLIDLLFVADVPQEVAESPTIRRPGTGTKVLLFTGCDGCLLSVDAMYQPSPAVITSGFSIAVWIQPRPNSAGYIMAKSSPDLTKVYYGLRVALVNSQAFSSVSLELTYTVNSATASLAAARSINDDLVDDAWHHLVVTIDDGEAAFYVDGTSIGVSQLAATSVHDGPGPLTVGGLAPGMGLYEGAMQDLRLFYSKLDMGELLELYHTPSREDISPISGYVTFSEGETTSYISISSLQDNEEEANEVFSIKLISARGGARVDDAAYAATLTVLKSDNANGLFGFSSPCTTSTPLNESAVFTCPITRRRGDADSVSLTWEVMRSVGMGQVLATDDFVNATGQLQFISGQRDQLLTIEVLDDDLPELSEVFVVHIVSVVSSDGEPGSTPTSGASIDPLANSQNITVSESDHPYGLLQFSTSAEPPGPGDPMVPPADRPPQVEVEEEVGLVRLNVVRAQGLLGEVSVEWRTSDDTAKSAGKVPADYQAQVGRLVFSPGQRAADISIRILDNIIPESEKSFRVELLNPSGGAAVGVGSVITVTIQHSDQAYGAFQFAQDALFMQVEELGLLSEAGVLYSQLPLTVVRDGGSIGQVNVSWRIQDDREQDFLQDTGVVAFDDGEQRGELMLMVRDDNVPELDETYIVVLTSATKGSLGESSKLRSSVTIVANDNPYGTFVISPSNRPIRLDEQHTDVVISVIRQAQSGTFGTVRVDYATLQPWETYPYLPGGVARADMQDFVNSSGSVVFEAGQMEQRFNITIREDDEAEVDEAVYVRLIRSVLLQPGDLTSTVTGSPSVGEAVDTIAQIIINQNDNPNGILELSQDDVRVDEDFTGTLVSVIRSGGTFGSVTVGFEASADSATAGLDYSVSSSTVTLLTGETSKPLPVEIINDRVPELEEGFVIRLLPQVTGGAVLGERTQVAVTIAESDDPYGAFGFESVLLSVAEPEGATDSGEVEIPVIRTGGTRGVVSVQWEATLRGEAASSDISPSSGIVYFVSNQARHVIKLSVLRDDAPEGIELIEVILRSASGGGRIMADKSRFTLQILPNDNPHGTVEFSQQRYVVREKENNGTQGIAVARIGGNYGRLRVTCSVEELDILSLALSAGRTVYTFYQDAMPNMALPMAGTNWDVSTEADPLTACATFCLITEACMSFDYSSDLVDCNWFTTGDYQFLNARQGYIFYAKDQTLTGPLYDGRALASLDFIAEQRTLVIDDGDTEGQLRVTILTDDLPELEEAFTVKLLGVELVDLTPLNPLNVPRLGNQLTSTVAIATNDDANGVFRIYSNDPRALLGGQQVIVEERDQFSVELIIERAGGGIGEVSVRWDVDLSRTNASQGADFIADGATVVFQPGDRQHIVKIRVARRIIHAPSDALTIGVEDDNVPENDEIILVELMDPQGGAVLGSQSTVSMVIAANDYVAGLLSFQEKSLLVPRGGSDPLGIVVRRSQPALGQVTTSWNITAVNSIPAADKFLVTSGNLFFAQGEVEKTIVIPIIVDNAPQLHQEYRVYMMNVRTAGVRSTGGAAVDPDNSVVVVTLSGGNEPHGVFSFTPTSLEKQVPEENAQVELAVIRNFGAIGAVRLHFDIKVGSLNPLTETRVLAYPEQDFHGVVGGSITLNNGESSGVITVQVNDDDTPEVDEVFIVNLTRVELVDSSSSSFQPRLALTYTLAEVVIGANDGTQGAVSFSPQTDGLRIQEGATDVTVTVQRTQGTFGRVSVLCFAQSPPGGAAAGEDFIFEHRTLVFGAGIAELSVTIQILEDNVPEPDEAFELILASPTNGLTLGTPYRISLSILASDQASGVISFDSDTNVTIHEPSSLDPSGGSTVARLRVERGPGVYGLVSLPYQVRRETGAEPGDDIQPVSGIVTFQDRQATTTIELSAVDDDLPEEAEVFIVVLGAPQNGALLGVITQRVVVIERNDAPYGLLQIYPHSTRNSSVSVDEDAGIVYLDVVRSQGSQDWVSVDLVTRPDTAIARTGPNFYLSSVQQFDNTVASRWYSFEAHGFTYVVLLNKRWTGELVSTVGSDGSVHEDVIGSTTPSMLYRWQGQLLPVQSIETDGASDAVSFVIDGQTYLSVSNAGGATRRGTRSRVYRVALYGRLTVIQDLATEGASGVEYFYHNQRHFLLITHSVNDLLVTSLNSGVYIWEDVNTKFSSRPSQYLSTSGASAVITMKIVDLTLVAMANNYNSGSRSYEVKSVLYKMDVNNQLTIHQQLDTQGAVTMATFTVDSVTYLVIGNRQDNSGSTQQMCRVYGWNLVNQLFETVQEIPVHYVNNINTFTMGNGIVHLVISNQEQPTSIYIWDTSVGQFNRVWSGPPSVDLYPIVISQRSSELTLMVEAPLLNTSVINCPVLQVNRLDVANSDVVPRMVTLHFAPGETLLSPSVYIIDDDLPETTESFRVALTEPRGGAELGASRELEVNILSNDDGHGRIEFAEDSLELYKEEVSGQENVVQLNVVREAGTSGRVSVRWRATGVLQPVTDIGPVTGTVEFADGQSVATISITIMDDSLPEGDETTLISLVEVLQTGTSLPGRGAVIGARSTARLTVLANDSPHGVVLWEQTSYTTSEPEGSDSNVALNIVRRQGGLGHIRVTYTTSRAWSVPADSQAVSGQDYLALEGTVDMLDSVYTASVLIPVLQDTTPEVNEVFWVNLTSVQLVSGSAVQGAQPSVRRPGNVASVTILENDDAQGVIQFSVNRNQYNRYDVYEGIGMFQLIVERTLGSFSAAEVSWQALPREADTDDFQPSGGRVLLAGGQTRGVIEISVVDDAIPENLETFDVQLMRVTSGSASIGSDRSVMVGIIRNDSPNGVFSFLETLKSVRESQFAEDPAGRVHFDIVRQQGSDGDVNIHWSLEPRAVSDFFPPLSGVVFFKSGETRQTISLQTKPDDILEGNEEFTLSLVSADNNGIIAHDEAATATVIILADPGASGVIAIASSHRHVYVGEPSDGYDGSVEVQLTRTSGLFGEVSISWQIVPRVLSAFTQYQGLVTFVDQQGTASIILQAVDDSDPEPRRMFTLEISPPTGGATLDTSARTAQITVVASDYPHGLFEFMHPSLITVAEDSGQVAVMVTRSVPSGSEGQVRVYYTTWDHTASSVAGSRQDYRPASGSLMFNTGVRNKTLTVSIINDDLAEPPESFFVNLTRIELLYPLNNNYSQVNGLQLDMAPSIGPLSSKQIVIDSNDNAEGFIQFAGTGFTAFEDDGVARIPLVRGPGVYGDVTVSYTATDISAQAGLDYLVPPSGEITIVSGASTATINITIVDDKLREFEEQFGLTLMTPTGGAQLGSRFDLIVTIAKSDFPNGKFMFEGASMVRLANPDRMVSFPVTISRTEGLLGRQTLQWRIMGPNNPNHILQETNDISVFTPEGREVTNGNLIWTADEGGNKTISVNIKPYVTEEIAKTFLFMIFDIAGFPATTGSGEVGQQSPNLTLIIGKHGDPNGIVRFDTEAQLPKTVEEPVVGMRTMRFPLYRREGTNGTLTVYWSVVGPLDQPPDVTPASGQAVIAANSRSGQVTFDLLSDDVPELNEKFTVVLTQVEGGAEIDTQFNTSVFTVQYNDNPHGRFAIHSDYQTVVVQPTTLNRQLLLNISRDDGAFGRVRINFATSYDEAQPGMSYVPHSGSVLFEDGQSEALIYVDIESPVFLAIDSTFSVSLTEIRYIGVGVTIPPQLDPEHSQAKVTVPAEAANSQVGFEATVLAVGDGNGEVEVTMKRWGTYGIVDIDWQGSVPLVNLPDGFNTGAVVPDTGTIRMVQAQEMERFTVQVLAQMRRAELFHLYIPRLPAASVPGGARLRPGSTVCRLDPHGLVRIDEASRQILVNENTDREVEVSVGVERLYGSEDSIQVRYTTVSGTALADVDYRAVENGAITLAPAQTAATIYIQVLWDDEPEEDEYFLVNLTSVTRLPTDLTQSVSPRLRELYSSAVVTIHHNSDPYGVVSITASPTRADEPSSVTLTVIRTGGSFGSIRIQVRTVGGGEAWDRFIDSTPGGANETIGQVLGNRDPDRQARLGEDYSGVDVNLDFLDSETEKDVVLYITDDLHPEDDEFVFVFITALTDGVRVAQPSTDLGLQGYAVVTIAKNDYWNGNLGFYPVNSSSVTVDEDTGSPAVLTIQRQDASFGIIEVLWRAVVEMDSEAARSDRIDLFTELPTTTGKVSCANGVTFCTFQVLTVQDQRPENATWFLIELFLSAAGSSQGAQIDRNRRFANVTMLASDYPNGRLQFAAEARLVYVDESSTRVSLQVERLGYQDKRVLVEYTTTQLDTPETVAGVKIYPALEGADYMGAGGQLEFPPGVAVRVIDISMDPFTASDNPFPKAFYVHLNLPSSNAELGEADAMVTIVDDQDIDVWAAWPLIQGSMNNESIHSTFDTLKRAIPGYMSHDQLTVTETILTRVLQQARTTPLNAAASAGILSVFCRLLDAEHTEDAVRGRWELSRQVEEYAYSLVQHRDCVDSPHYFTSGECPLLHIEVVKDYPEGVNGYQYSTSQDDNLRLPSNILRVQEHGRDSSNPRCYSLAIIEYSSDHWFTRQDTKLLNNKVLSSSLQDQEARFLDEPVRFRIYTPDKNLAARRASCQYFSEDLELWTTGNDVCSVVNNLALALDTHVDCACKHMSLYTVVSDVARPDLIGYPLWFHIACFICIAGLALAIIAHHICLMYSAMFSANLLMHLCFAILATQVCYVIDAFLSPTHILASTLDENNYRCIVMSLFLHYFFLAQFTWMMTQAINFYKTLVLNDEHTERKYVLYFFIGWGLPICILAVFYIATYVIYRYTTDLPADHIYGDVTGNLDVCFLTHPYAGLAGVVLPVLVCLMVVAVVFIQAFQVTPQWQAYDDVYKGRYNINEVRLMLFFWALLVMTWLWGGLHMVYSQLWMLILFCIFNVIMGLYAFVVYGALRNPCFPCFRPQKAAYSINATMSEGSVQVHYPHPHPRPPSSSTGSKDSQASEHWERDSISRQSLLHVKRTMGPSGVYTIPHPSIPPSHPTDDSRDFDDLIYALKSNRGYDSSDISHPIDHEIDEVHIHGIPPSASNGTYERKRIPIADTHL